MKLSGLSDAVRGRVRSGPEELDRFGRDMSFLVGHPLAVVTPADAEDVGALIRWARRVRVPLVARGAGTSLDGESVPSDGAVVVDLSPWNQVFEVDPEELWARVGPGVVNRELQRSLRSQGVFFPPNPGSWMTATVGGNVATNASGPRSFKYGPTRLWVREVEAVLGTGERARFGARVAKRSVGPELLHLLVGSEGTLGIITEVTVRLAPLPARREGLVVPLPPSVSLSAVARRLRPLSARGLSAVELIDRDSATVLVERRSADLPQDASLLLLEVEGADERETTRERATIVAALGSVGIHRDPTVFPEADELWTLRGQSGVALDERMGHRVREDVAVPLSRIDDFVERMDGLRRSHGVRLYLYGHLGEGSFHPNFAVDPASPAGARIRVAILSAALELGGTVSSEHGIGRLKVGHLARELGAPPTELLRAVKQQCDPDGILNPGKLYPPPEAPAASPSRSPSGPADG